jgi:hypothetical protein
MAAALVHLISTYQKKERRVNKTSSIFEQFKVLRWDDRRREREKKENDERIEHDPCENNEYKDTLEKSVWYRDIQLQGCVM